MSAQRAMNEGDRRATDEAAIRQHVDKLVAAIRAMDLESVMSAYAPEVVAFDIVPPLRNVGAMAQKKNWADVFEAYRAPLGYEVRELAITLSDDVAFAHSLNRISGTLKNGTRTALWLRWTTGFQKIDGKWLIAHHQASVPIDVETRRALLDLEP